MDPASPPAGPVGPVRPPGARSRLRAPSRLTGVDAARAVALLGMVATHVLPLVAADGTATATALTAAGRASALFAVLAGVSLGLASGARRPPSGTDLRRARAGVTARAGVIGVVGLLLGTFGPPVAVILVNYALLFLLALPVLGWGPRRLLPLGAAWLLLAPVVAFPLRRLVTGDLLPVSPGTSPDLLSLLDPGLLLGHLLLTGYYPVVTWAGFVLLGLGVGRLDLRAPSVLGVLAVAGAVAAGGAQLVAAVLRPLAAGSLAVPAGFPLSAPTPATALETGLYGTTPTTSWWWLAVVTPHSGTPLDLVHVAGSALAVLGVLLLVERVARPVLRPLAAVGSMTLTLYSLHVFSLVAAEPWIRGSAVLGTTAADPALVYVLQVVGLVALALLWQLTGRRGPLEGVAAAASTAARDGVRAA